MCKQKLKIAFFLGITTLFFAPTTAWADRTISVSATTLQPGQKLTVSDSWPLTGTDAMCTGGPDSINTPNCPYTTQVWFWRNNYRYKQAPIVSSGDGHVTVIVPEMPSAGVYRVDIEHIYTGRNFFSIYGETDNILKIVHPATSTPTLSPSTSPSQTPTPTLNPVPTATPTSAPLPENGTQTESTKPAPNFFQNIFSTVRNWFEKIFKGKSDKATDVATSSPTQFPAASPTPQPSITPSATPTPVPTPIPSPTPKPVTYVHSPDSDLGVNGFTVSGGQNSESGGHGIIYLKVHGEFTFHGYIWNYGTGMAANVPWIWYDNDKIIKQGVIDHLAPGAETNVTVSFNSASYSGQHVHKLVVNPDHKLPEKTYETNIGTNPWFVEPF